MARINFVTGKENTKLQGKVNDFAIKYFWRGLENKKLSKEAEDLKTALKAAKMVQGTVGADKYVSDLREALDKVEEKKKAVAINPKARFPFNNDADKALKDEWKKSTTEAMKCSAMSRWLDAYGIKADANACLPYVRAMGGSKTTGLRTRAEGGAFTDERGFSVNLFMSLLVDAHMEVGLIREDIIPEELVNLFKAEKEAAEARKKARKEARKTKKAEAKAEKKEEETPAWLNDPNNVIKPVK